MKNIEITEVQATTVAAWARARILTAKRVLTSSYRRDFLGHMPDAHYEQISAERREEIAMLEDLIAKVEAK